jgi:acyl-CoA thioesterase
MPDHEREQTSLHAEPARIAAFDQCEFSRLLGMRILEASDGYGRVEMDGSGKLNSNGVLHGGAIFALADQAFGIAANCDGTSRVAVSVSILYIAPSSGNLVATARRVSDNGPCDTYRVIVQEGERLIAEFEGVAFRV